MALFHADIQAAPRRHARIRVAAFVLVLPLSACVSIDLPDAVERTVTKTFTVQPHATVHVKLRGGSKTSIHAAGFTGKGRQIVLHPGNVIRLPH